MITKECYLRKLEITRGFNAPCIVLIIGKVLFNCIYMLPDSIQAFLLGTLQGFKDSKVTLYIIMFSYLVVGIPCCYMLSWGTFGEPLKASGIWIGFIICLLTAAICYAFRTRYLLKHKIMLLPNEKFD